MEAAEAIARVASKLAAATAGTASRPHVGFDPILWGERGGFYLAREPVWIRRHVETIDISGSRLGRRRLTIDFSLPERPECVIDQGPRGNLYCLPIALLGSRSPRSKIDFLDEEDRRLPLLGRRENALISAFAMRAAVERHIDGELPEAMQDALLALIARVGRLALFQLYLFEYAAKRELPLLTQGPAWPFIRHAAESLVNDSIIWLPLIGLPGERRSVRLAYQIPLGPPTLIKQHIEERTEQIPVGDDVVSLQIPRAVGIDVSETLRRVRARIGVRLAISAIEMEIQGPAIDDCDSYHLQVEAPAGLTIKGVKRDASIGVRAGAVLDDQQFLTPQGAHLYLAGHSVKTPGSIVVSLQPARGGLVSESALAGVLISVLLWFFALHWPAASTTNSSQTTAAILLLGPGLLAAFVYRPARHLLAARLLTGVRGLVLAAGVASVCVAASLVGAVRIGLAPQECAVAFAGVATIAALWLLAVWIRLLPWEGIQRNRRRWWTQVPVERGRWAVFTMLASLAAGTAAVVAREFDSIFGRDLHAAAIVPLGLLIPWPMLYVAGWGVATLRSPTGVAIRVGAFVVGAFATAAVLTEGLEPSATMRTMLLTVAVLAGALALSSAGVALHALVIRSGKDDRRG